MPLAEERVKEVIAAIKAKTPEGLEEYLNESIDGGLIDLPDLDTLLECLDVIDDAEVVASLAAKKMERIEGIVADLRSVDDIYSKDILVHYFKTRIAPQDPKGFLTLDQGGVRAQYPAVSPEYDIDLIMETRRAANQELKESHDKENPNFTFDKIIAKMKELDVGSLSSCAPSSSPRDPFSVAAEPRVQEAGMVRG